MKSKRRQGWLVAGVGLPLIVIGAVYAKPGGEGGDRPEKGDRPQGSIVDRFDANHDGVLTEAEVPAKLWAKISAADADGNGQVTIDELKANGPQRDGDRPKPEGDRPKPEGDRPTPEGMFDRFDANGDGALTETEVPERLWNKISGADADGNGQINLDEFKTAGQGHGDRPGPKPEGDRPSPQAMFNHFDANGDGVLTEAEVPAEVWNKISGADADGNGQVTVDEFKAAHPDKPEGDRPGPQALFEKFDANHDGVLTEDEVPAELWAKISQGDADGNGQITPDELPHGPRGDKPRGPGALFERFDANHDGALTEAEVPAELWAKISQGDADGNGQVTAEEMPQRPHDGNKPPREGHKPPKGAAE